MLYIHDLDFKRYLTKLYLQLKERMKRETIRKKAKWVSEWTHGNARKISDGRFTFSQIFLYATKRKYAPGSTKSEIHALKEVSQILFTVTVEEEHLSQLCGGWQKAQSNLISNYCMVYMNCMQ